MRIESSQISMEGRHSSVERYQKQENLRVWVDPEQPTQKKPHKSAVDTVQLSDKAYSAQEADSSDDGVDKETALKALLVERLVEMITGMRVKITTVKVNADAVEVSVPAPPQDASSQVNQPPQREGWGVRYDFHESYFEREEMTFKAQGVVKTTDGKEIKFDLQFTMTREFSQETNINFRAGDALKIDPLVINFDGNAAQLTDKKFAFDLNADGTKDNISFVKAGSGFLALDLNKDGVINDGKELFGPQSGNGFTELAKYDQDHNNWIDEQDAVFSQLRIWTKDGEGKDTLSTLLAKNVGAIYLGSTATSFDIRDSQNTSQGDVKSTGVYLKESGGAGSVQQIDLAA
ncbi:MAG: VCBS repeat-containing protein [Nitrospirota bacterium]|nr:VCBS repeat-containing protein [Nitrospirota bacterium]